MAKMNVDDLENTLEPILAMFKAQRSDFEAFGDFCDRVGPEAITQYMENYNTVLQ
eukprot:CAMPEP_0113478516 /NCGR_PEP_ID=MMETSP0014_2-20120614/20800_1 /TAXON_ID=2857 /ORGANISM="Nitzschia sp." /LENGTH=54 /DNA_ID=CAMNT_0000371717 /DNA_START=51 /DNA_END=215 /DNA_ORIENTATION=- /assembly_acc=CAM_ASM_000159